MIRNPLRGRTAIRREGSLALLFCILAACGPPPPGVSNQHYRAGKLKDRTLHVLPLRVLKIHSPGNLESSLVSSPYGNATTAALTRLFQSHLAAYGLSSRLSMDSAWTPEPQALRETTLYIPGERNKWPLDLQLVKPELMQEKGFAPDLALLVTHVEAMRDFNTLGGKVAPPEHFQADSSNPGVSSGVRMEGGKTFLAVIGRYMIWDYLEGRPVCYGRFAAGSIYSNTVTRENWDEAVREAVAQVVENSPYQGAKSSERRPPKPPPQVRNER